MSIGTQEIIALMIVAAVVGFALFRRLRKKSAATSACSGCDTDQSTNSNEKPIRFYKKQR